MGTAFLIISARAKTGLATHKSATANLQDLPPKLGNGPVQVVRFTLYDVGIYPSEVHARKGLVAISIEDYSGGTSGLVVDRLTGIARVGIGKVTRQLNQSRARGETLMTPGRYEVYDASRPKNRALLIVEP
jgi:hypothetical protein